MMIYDWLYQNPKAVGEREEDEILLRYWVVEFTSRFKHSE